jgi:hypothetical protein
MSIAGHVSREMLDHYSHIRITAKRRALEAMETPIPDLQASVPVESVPETVNSAYVTNRVTIRNRTNP